jgi:simple sugar transport system ATP-binding protein
MVGREVSLAERQEGRSPGETVLEVEGLRAEGDRGEEAVRGVSFAVRAGEILGVAGVAGNGQRELAEALIGMRRVTHGQVRVAGRRLRRGHVRATIRAGVGYVPEDRLGTGVAPGLSVGSNLALKSYRGRRLSRGPLLLLPAIRKRAASLIREYDVRGAGPQTPARQLSGGNIQKVVLAREFTGEPRVLVAAAPTRGLDVAAIESVHGYLRRAAEDGVAILLISEDLDEILALADRVLVMYEGAVAGETEAAGASVEEIGLMMAGGSREE